jgi:outer membrane receptor protein involved in Fe transport
MKLLRIAAVFAAILLAGTSLFAQGTTAALTGTVTQDGTPLPGVTVTISSAALQGTRTAYTNENGGYSFPSIPPGTYSVLFEMEGLQPVTKTQQIGLAQTGRVNAEMRISAVSEAITVTASAPAVLETQEVQSNISATLVEDLPIARTLQGTTLLAPGVSTNAQTTGIQISGAYSYDNLFLVNGAVTNENLRGQTHNLFIEDAIQETTVMTGAISAEYGRFTGGVISAITKSGGNDFTGSFRDSLTNPDWTAKTPFPGQQDPLDTINEVYEATLGGRIIRDRLWFFGAGRLQELENSLTLTRSANQFTFGQEETRLEGKLTGQLTQSHNLVASFLDLTLDETNYCFVGCIEETPIDPSRSLPQDFLTVQYNGVLTSNWLAEVGYSRKNFAFVGSGSDLRAIPGQASLEEIARATSGWDGYETGHFFGDAVFCGICDPEERNNGLWTLKSTYYLSTPSLGSHSIVAGYENWAEQRIANNIQSGSDFFVNIYSTSVVDSRDASGRTHPTIMPGDGIAWWPLLEYTQGSDWKTSSFFVNDKWDLNNHWSFNLGVRYDANSGTDSSGNKIADDSEFSPRLGAIYDVKGDGAFRLNASYSRYVSRIAETVGGSAGRGGNPAAFYWEYYGDPINEDLSLDYVGAFRQLFEWFFAQGEVAIPTAYGNILVPNADALYYIDIPGLTSQFLRSLSSPSVDEITIGGGFQISDRGFVRADLINREWKGIYSQRIDTTTGTVPYAPFGLDFDLGIVENTDDVERTYNGVQLQASYRLLDRLNLGGNYTWSQTEGNTTGETRANGPITDASSQYPEYRAFSRNNPIGLLEQVDQTHKARLWVSYDIETPFGRVNISALERFDSGTAYSAVGAIDLRYRSTFYGDGLPGGIENPGYATPPSSLNYYFSDRGEYRWDDEIATDLAVNYALPIRNVELFAQAEVINLFDQDAVVAGDTTVLTARNDGSLTRFNPVAGDVPQENVHYRLGDDFGQAVSQNSYQLPRTYRISLGLRF